MLLYGWKRPLFLDTGSCTNAVSEKALKKLGFKVQSHPYPYNVAWITNTKLRVDKQYLVTFEIGKLKGDCYVWCVAP